MSWMAYRPCRVCTDGCQSSPTSLPLSAAEAEFFGALWCLNIITKNAISAGLLQKSHRNGLCICLCGLPVQSLLKIPFIFSIRDGSSIRMSMLTLDDLRFRNIIDVWSTMATHSSNGTIACIRLRGMLWNGDAGSMLFMTSISTGPSMSMTMLWCPAQSNSRGMSRQSGLAGRREYFLYRVCITCRVIIVGYRL